ncbi:SLATT domain-containing protein [Geodermatophilus sp. URMC 61]|uniref:SLATT domain-containing protein n=1 Tax=Geodermatophilus sp. URMC 61 TaxID=3423411 RepID=UPI00406D2D83
MLDRDGSTCRRRSSTRRESRLWSDPGEPLPPPTVTTGEALTLVLERCLTQASAQRRSAKRWKRRYLLFGIPTAVLPAISGATSLAVEAGRVPGATIALLASALAAAAAFLDSQRRSQSHDKLAVGWHDLADRTRLALLDLQEHRLDTDSARDELAKILSLQTRLLRSAVDHQDEPRTSGHEPTGAAPEK